MTISDISSRIGVAATLFGLMMGVLCLAYTAGRQSATLDELDKAKLDPRLTILETQLTDRILEDLSERLATIETQVKILVDEKRK